METIISPTTSSSDLNNGVFLQDGKFIDKYKNNLSDNWVVYCYWSSINSRYGNKQANLLTAKFCNDHNLKNTIL